MTQKFLPIAFFQGKFLPFKEANLSIATQALHYGTGTFGGLRGVYKKDSHQLLLFRLEKHCQRLSNGAKLLNHDVSPEYIRSKILEFVNHNQIATDIYIRPLIYVSDLGIAPRLFDNQKDFLIYGIEMGDYLNPEGIKVTFSSWTRPSDNSTPIRGKITGNYISSALAKTEAHNRGFDEALILDSRGFVCEASAMNLFMVKNQELVTPPVQSDILEGITRLSILEIALKLGIKVTERDISKSELLLADEVFLTGTAAKITPINQIEFYKLPSLKPITGKLKKIFKEITNGNSKEYQDWVTKISLK